MREVVDSLAKGREDKPVDLSGHGTHLAGIVIQLTPHADLCIARVLKHNLTTYDTGEAARRVALVRFFRLIMRYFICRSNSDMGLRPSFMLSNTGK